MKNKREKMKKVNFRNTLFMFLYLCIGSFIAHEPLNAQDISVPSSEKEPLAVKSGDELPEFFGGMDALVKYMSEQIVYPEVAIANKVEGTVYVGFLVDKTGAVRNVVIKKGVTDELNREAVRVVDKMPDWKPGTIDGKPADIEMVLPVKFKL